MGGFWDFAGTYGPALLAVMGIIVTVAPQATLGRRKLIWIVAFAIVAFLTARGTQISQRKIEDEITGGDSWGLVTIIIYDTNSYAVGINVSNQGVKYTLHNVRVWISNQKEGFARPQISAGDISPNSGIILPPPIPNIAPNPDIENHYIISILATNGVTNEDYYIKMSETADGKKRWNQRAEIYKTEPDGKKHMLREIPWSKY